MVTNLFRASDSLFVLAGYESGKVALWEIKHGTSHLVWEQDKGHNEPGKQTRSI